MVSIGSSRRTTALEPSVPPRVRINLARRFASRDEVLEWTGLTPGSIPPFGSLFGLATYCDERLADETVINFNAGDHSRSMSMSYTEFHRVEQPEIGSFAE